MKADAATNPVSPTEYSSSLRTSGISANPDILVGGMEPWKRDAIQKMLSYACLQPNWDGRGSHAPSIAVRQAAYELLRKIPSPSLPVPRVVPVSGGGYHFEWAVGQRELEISVDPQCRVEALRVENGMPGGESERVTDLPALFGWLTR